jgi:hypothetical protein
MAVTEFKWHTNYRTIDIMKPYPDKPASKPESKPNAKDRLKSLASPEVELDVTSRAGE